MITNYNGIVTLLGQIGSVCKQFSKAFIVLVSDGKEYHAECGGNKKVITDSFKTMMKRYKEGECNESEKMLAESLLTALSTTYSIKELPEVFLGLLNEYLPNEENPTD